MYPILLRTRFLIFAMLLSQVVSLAAAENLFSSETSFDSAALKKNEKGQYSIDEFTGWTGPCVPRMPQTAFSQLGKGEIFTEQDHSKPQTLMTGIGYGSNQHSSYIAYLGNSSFQFLKSPSNRNKQVLVIVLYKQTKFEPIAPLLEAITSMSPRFIVLDIDEQDPTAVQKLIDDFLEVTKVHIDVVKQVGNTVALSTDSETSWDKPILLLLDDKPWEPTGELAELIQRMEASCKASQEVFKKLSVEQMNFKPSNGSHTPRWNAEHMLGRQLGFFSQIFSTIDPSIKHIDLNPKQMPKNYVAAHPDWSGEQEAQLMQRVSDYVRCYVYLLKDINLDEPAPGSRWTLRRLLKQMDNHYTEHTANVKKKFELPDWPTQ